VIKVRNLTKHYRNYPRSLPALFRTLATASSGVFRTALDGISFEAGRGQTVGLIGSNGSGKTTLLKILAGILLPDDGSFTIKGRVATLLHLGCGLLIDATVRDNVFLLMGYCGMTYRAIRNAYASIVNFAGLEEYQHVSLGALSSGMRMRLAFSCAMHLEPDAFIIDEVFSVGDIRFQQKCIEKLKSHKLKGGTTIIASHDLNAVKVFSDQAMLLNEGRLVSFGHPKDAVDAYNRILALPPAGGMPPDASTAPDQDRSGDSIKLISADVVDMDMRKKILFSVGEGAIVRLLTKSLCQIENVTIGFVIRDYLGRDIFGTNTYYLDEKVSLEEGVSYEQQFVIQKLDLAPGDYTISVACHDGCSHSDGHRFWHDAVAAFSIVRSRERRFIGCAHLNINFRHQIRV